MKEEWLFRGALVPIDAATTAALVAEIKRLIDVVGGMALAQPEQGPVAYVRGLLASRLTCWHRLTGAESDELVALFQAMTVQEPVAWGFRHHDGAIYDCISPEAHADCEGEYTVPLYTTPPKPEPRNFCPRCGKRTNDIHTCTPPRGLEMT